MESETAMRLGLLPSLQNPPSLQDPGIVTEPNGDIIALMINEINMISDSDETLVDSEVYSPPTKKIKIEAEVSMQRGYTPSSKSMIYSFFYSSYRLFHTDSSSISYTI